MIFGVPWAEFLLLALTILSPFWALLAIEIADALRRRRERKKAREWIESLGRERADG